MLIEMISAKLLVYHLALEVGFSVDSIYTHFSKTFDKVYHGFLQKLFPFGIPIWYISKMF